MKLLLSLSLILISLSLYAKRINLNYEPIGQIIVIHYDSLTIITDSTALFSIYKDTDNSQTSIRLKNFIRKESKMSNGDTLVFSGDFIPFNDSIDNSYVTDWYVKWAIIELTNKKKLKLYDKHGQVVRKIKRGKNKMKKDIYAWYKRKAYINRENKEVLFYKTECVATFVPVF